MDEILRRPAGASIGFKDTLKDLEKNNTSATSYTIELYDNEGNLVATVTMAETSITGIYTGSWQSASGSAKGVYRARQLIVNGSYTTIKETQQAFILY